MWKMHESLKLAVSLIFLPSFVAGCTNAQIVSPQARSKIESPSQSNLSTDEAVLAELQKRADAEREKLGLANKKSSRLETKDVCIKRFKESEKIIVIGFFAHDVGCRFGGAFVNSRFYEKTDANLSKDALAAFGWEKAPKREREMLAKFWVEKGLLPFFTVLYTKDENLNSSEFHPPQVISKENGEIKVTLWIRLPSGMSRERGYQLLEYRFAADGNLSGSSALVNLLL